MTSFGFPVGAQLWAVGGSIWQGHHHFSPNIFENTWSNKQTKLHSCLHKVIPSIVWLQAKSNLLNLSTWSKSWFKGSDQCDEKSNKKNYIKCDSLLAGLEYLVWLNLRKWMISSFEETCSRSSSFMIMDSGEKWWCPCEETQFYFSMPNFSPKYEIWLQQAVPLKKKQTTLITQYSNECVRFYWKFHNIWKFESFYATKR